MDYTGYKQIHLTDDELTQFYSTSVLPYNCLENEYLILVNENGDAIDYYRCRNNKLEHVNFPIINTSTVGKIKPLDPYQYCAMDLLQQKDVPIKLIRGVYGSGKDYLMFNQALSLIEKGKFDKLVFIRPNVTLANVPQIGYLPNGIEEKLGWTMAPLYDKIGGEEGIKQLEQQGVFEMVPLLFIRGRSFENSLVYVTEAQNIDSRIAKVLLSRIGTGSELWLNGDNHNQTDSHVFEKDNGFQLMIERLSGNHLFGYVYLPITHRSEVANLSNLLD